MDQDKLKLAIVAACPIPLERGTPVRILRLAEGLAERGHEIHLVTYHLGFGDIDDRIQVHRTPRVPTYKKLSPGPTYQKLLVMDPFLTITLRGVLRRHKIDLIHAHHYEGLLVAKAAGLGKGIPVVYDAHTLLASELPAYGLGLSSSLKKTIGVALDRRLPDLAHHIISVTQKIKDRVEAATEIPGSSISVISNGVELELFEEGAPPEREPQAIKTVAFTGNLASYQGIDLLLQAFARIAASRNDMRLVIASDSSFEPYEALAAELNVRQLVELVPGKFANVPSVLADANITVSPRVDCDGIPQKILNYMAASRPVVAFRGSAPGLVHGQTAWLVDDGEVSAFADGIMALADDVEQAERIGKQARSYVKSNHSWASVAAETEQLYRELLGLASANESLYPRNRDDDSEGSR